SQGGQRWVSLGLPGGGASITLLQAADTENLRAGTQKLYFTTRDAKSLWQAVKARGITPTHDWTTETWAGSPWASWFSLADPDGNQVIIAQMKPSAE
ncbi:MAG TPA: VOC family protein, partial [Spirochaetia bacterium]|nr:VOC family protein [Spirochaetia bacterium]